RKRAAEDRAVPFDVEERDLRLRVADPDTRRELRHVSAEPGVLVVLGGARLTDRGAPEVGRRAGAVRDDAFERVGDEVGGVLRYGLHARCVQLADLATSRPAHELEGLRVTV